MHLIISVSRNMSPIHFPAGGSEQKQGAPGLLLDEQGRAPPGQEAPALPHQGLNRILQSRHGQIAHPLPPSALPHAHAHTHCILAVWASPLHIPRLTHGARTTGCAPRASLRGPRKAVPAGLCSHRAAHGTCWASAGDSWNRSRGDREMRKQILTNGWRWGWLDAARCCPRRGGRVATGMLGTGRGPLLCLWPPDPCRRKPP